MERGGGKDSGAARAGRLGDRGGLAAQVATCGRDGAVRVWDGVGLGEVATLGGGGGGGLAGLDWNPDGMRIAIADGCGASVWLATVEDSDAERRPNGTTGQGGLAVRTGRRH